jgi:hypothetical protein
MNVPIKLVKILSMKHAPDTPSDTHIERFPYPNCCENAAKRFCEAVTRVTIGRARRATEIRPSTQRARDLARSRAPLPDSVQSARFSTLDKSLPRPPAPGVARLA